LDRFDLGFIALLAGAGASLRIRLRWWDGTLAWLPAGALALYVWGNASILKLDPSLGAGSLQEARLCVLFVIALTGAQFVAGLRASSAAAGILVWPAVLIAEFLKSAFLENPGTLDTLRWRELLLTVAAALILVSVAHEAFEGLSSQSRSRPQERIAGLFSCFAAVVLFWGRGEHFLPGFDLDFYKVIRTYDGSYQVLSRFGRRSAEYVTVPGAGTMLTLALIVAALHGLLTLVRVFGERWLETNRLERVLRRVFGVELFFLIALAGLLVWADGALPGFKWLAEPFRMALLLAVPAMALPVGGLLLVRTPFAFERRDTALLTTRLALVLVSLSLLAGAWSEYQLSGSYWDWSLRETVSLLIWLAASLYLHVRVPSNILSTIKENSWPANSSSH